MTAPCRIDVEFFLAIHNRTGKYFIGRDIIGDNEAIIRQAQYWRLTQSAGAPPPHGLYGRIAGRLAVMEARYRATSPAFDRVLPRRRIDLPLLHLDPLTVLFHRLARHDLVLCHDVGPITHPALFPADVVAMYRKAYAEIADAAPHMIFVSRATEAAFHKLYAAEYASSDVIYPSLRSELDCESQAPLPISGPFLLTVGAVGDRKNQKRAIAGFARSGLAQKGVHYVICGGPEQPGYNAVTAAAAATEGVILLSYVGDEELNWLFKRAAGFVLPSLLEGFGVPVAEAISAGLVPLVSRDSVLEEVAGRGALSVDPLDEYDIAEKMRQLIAMPDADKQQRLATMTASLGRFSRVAFKEGWRQLLSSPAPAQYRRATGRTT